MIDRLNIVFRSYRYPPLNTAPQTYYKYPKDFTLTTPPPPTQQTTSVIFDPYIDTHHAPPPSVVSSSNNISTANIVVGATITHQQQQPKSPNQQQQFRFKHQPSAFKQPSTLIRTKVTECMFFRCHVIGNQFFNPPCRFPFTSVRRTPQTDRTPPC